MPMWSRVWWWTLNLQWTYNDCTWEHLLSFTEVAYGWTFVFWSTHFSYKFYQLESTSITIAMYVSEVITKLLCGHLLMMAGTSAHVCFQIFSLNSEKGAEAGHHLLEARSSIGCNWVSAQIGQPRTWSFVWQIAQLQQSEKSEVWQEYCNEFLITMFEHITSLKIWSCFRV